jgi:hypothetical protein
MRKLLVVVIGVVLGATSCAQGGKDTPPGRVAQPIDGAARVAFRLLLGRDAERARHLPMEMRIKNLSDGSILIGRCSVQAVDAHNFALFTIKSARPFTGSRATIVLRPGEVSTTRSPPGFEGVAPAKASVREVRAVERYRNEECRIFRWIGPLPESDS